jgi:heme/copper-type cytochrome/quinol oxidase subunit 2
MKSAERSVDSHTMTTMESLAYIVAVMFVLAYVLAFSALAAAVGARRSRSITTTVWALTTAAVVVNAFFTIQTWRLGGLPLLISLAAAGLLFSSRSRSLHGPAHQD